MTAQRESPAEKTNPHDTATGVEPFAVSLERHGLALLRGRTHTLQVNTGLLCNLSCRHCHLDAGPNRKECMTRQTVEAVLDFALRVPFQVVDITGGAPELMPDLPLLIEGFVTRVPRLILRSNLSALAGPDRESLLDLCVMRKVVLIASFPSTHPAQTDSQRGAGAAEAAVAMLRRLNAAGYGLDGTGLELDLVANPVGAFLPASQAQAERKFRHDLMRRWGVSFNRLYTFANVPMGRFRRWLIDSGNYERYVGTLADSFNPCTVGGLMCRTQISVSWDGYLYDCDFNLAAGRFLGGRRTHVSGVREIPAPGTPIVVGDYCYACTAGSGFT